MPSLTTLQRALPTAALGVAAMGAIWVLRRVDPNAPGGILPACPFWSLTGLYCPGCGSTRCLHALAHGECAHAMDMNPLLPLALPVVALMAISAAGWNPAGLAVFRKLAGNPRLWLYTLCSYWIARNLPWPPFQ